MFAETGLGGRVAVTGRADLGAGFAALQHLTRARPEVEFVGAVDSLDVITRARATKDEAEVERIRQMGKATVNVVADVANFLTAHRARNGVLVNQHDEVLTIGEVKRRINLWLAMRGAENPEGTIFAIGRDAGVPHSVGDDSRPGRDRQEHRLRHLPVRGRRRLLLRLHPHLVPGIRSRTRCSAP